MKDKILFSGRFLTWFFIYQFLVIFYPILAISSIKKEIHINNGSLIYYFEEPDSVTYPILIAIEGSYRHNIGPQSVLRLHNKLSQAVLENQMALITMERRGVNGGEISKEIFYQYNTVSQRLEDHIQLIEHLKNSPPDRWNGQLIIMGGSEGGPIAVKLAKQYNPLACIVLVSSCTDKPFKERAWEEVQAVHNSIPRFVHPIVNWWYQLPSDREAFDEWCKMIENNPDPNRFWMGQTYHYLSDAFNLTIYQDFLLLNCPCLVVSGSEDIGCCSTDHLVEDTLKKNQDVTYLRIDGMGHDVLEPKWQVLENIFSFLKEIRINF